MSSDNPEVKAYSQLSESISKNDNLHHIHFGCSRSELEEFTVKNNQEDGPVTSSPFVKDTKPVAYYYTFEKIINEVVNTSDNINGVKVISKEEKCLEYKVNDNSHCLTGFVINNILPKAVAKKGYQICWSHSVGSNINKYGVFYHNDTIVYHWDSITSDINSTYPQKGEDIDSINLDLGNTHDLQSFSKQLPQKNVVFVPSLPFNSVDPSDHFPLYKCAYKDIIKISLILKKDPQSLLIIAKENADGSLEIITPSSETRYADFYLDGKAVDNFRSPTIVAHYAYMSQDECNGKWCNNGLEKTSSTSNVAFYINQQIAHKTRNTSDYIAVKIEDITTTHVVTSIAWLAEQKKCRDRHIYSNYTTNPSSQFLGGCSPITQSTIDNGKAILLDKLPSIVTSRDIARIYYRKSPCLPGIHIKTFGIRGSDNTIKPGFLFEKGTISVELEETDPLVLDGQLSGTTDQYNVHARLTCRIPFTFTTFASSEKDRNEMPSTIIAIVKN